MAWSSLQNSNHNNEASNSERSTSTDSVPRVVVYTGFVLFLRLFIYFFVFHISNMTRVADVYRFIFLDTGQIERKFVEVPVGATWVEFTMKTSGFKTARRFFIDSVQV